MSSDNLHHIEENNGTSRIYIPRHRLIQRVYAWVDMKSAAGATVVFLLGVCLILSSKAVHDVNNRTDEYADMKSVKNMTDRLLSLENQKMQQGAFLNHIHTDVYENYYDIEYLEYDVEQIRNYVSIPNCPKDWVEFEGTCFYISNSIQKTDWNSSSKECKKLNGNAEMAIKTTEKQNKFIILKAMGEDSHLNPELWIGGIKKDEQWKWNDGTNLKSELSKQIKEEEHLNQQCLVLSKKHETLNISFSSTYCSNGYQYVCQFVPEVSCQEGWLARGKNCYLFSTSQATWNDSRKHCQDFGDDSDLFTASSVADLSFKEKNERKEDDYYYYYNWGEEHWVGGYDELGNGHFMWLNVSDITEDSQYWKYWDGPSRDNKRRCVGASYIDGQLKLTQNKCEDYMYYICQKGPESFKGIDHHLGVIDSKVMDISAKEKDDRKNMETIEEKYQKKHKILTNKLESIEDRIEAIEERKTKQVTTGTSPTTSPSKTSTANVQ